LGKVSALLAHREKVPVEAAFAAQLIGALEEGCGSCVQIHIGMARRAGLRDHAIEALLRDDQAALSPDAALAARFALAISRRSGDESEARDAVRARWGEKGVIDLVMATQVSRFLTMLKAGFGHATACDQLSVGPSTIVPVRRAA
jgi:AhpD family alkylhydroperoxidase